MIPLNKARLDVYLHLKVSERFKDSLEKATRKEGLRSVSEFIRAAVIERAAKAGIVIDPLK
jgi:uncharacterized protein (DUF1778 family)